MTIQEMHRRYKLSFDKIDSLAFPDIEPEEIDEILNIAIERFWKQRYGKTNPKRESFEETQKRIDDLRTIVNNASTTAEESGDMLNFYTFALPADYMILIKSFTETKILFCGVQYGAEEEEFNEKGVLIATPELYRKGTQQIQLDDLNAAFDDPFNRPGIQDDVLLTFEEGKIRVYTGKLFSVRKLEITYLREPAKVSLTTSTDCDLPDHTHQEIVEIAVNWSIESVESQRYGTQTNELNKIE